MTTDFTMELVSIHSGVCCLIHCWAVVLWSCGGAGQHCRAALVTSLAWLSETRWWGRGREESSSPPPQKQRPSLPRVHTRWIKVRRQETIFSLLPQPPAKDCRYSRAKEEGQWELGVPILRLFSRQVGHHVPQVSNRCSSNAACKASGCSKESGDVQLVRRELEATAKRVKCLQVVSKGTLLPGYSKGISSYQKTF